MILHFCRKYSDWCISLKIWQRFELLFCTLPSKYSQIRNHCTNLIWRDVLVFFFFVYFLYESLPPSHPLSPFSTVTSIISMCFFITSTNVFWSLPLRIYLQTLLSNRSTLSAHFQTISTSTHWKQTSQPFAVLLICSSGNLFMLVTPGEILSIILLSLLSYNSSFSTLLLLYFNKTFLTPHFHPFHPACILFSNFFCALSISLQGWPSVHLFPKLNTDYGSQSSTCWSP